MGVSGLQGAKLRIFFCLANFARLFLGGRLKNNRINTQHLELLCYWGAFRAVYLNCDLTLRDDCNKTPLLSIEHVRNG